jgi:uncharacterized protein
MRILVVVLSMAATVIGTACVDGTPIRAERARRVVRLVKTVETTMSVPLAQEYARTMPDLDLQFVDGGGTGGTVSAIQRGDADLGFILADVAYFANADAQRRHDSHAEIRGIAALQTAPVHLVARSGIQPSQVMQLPPLRIGVNSAFSSQFILARLVLGAYGIKEGTELPQFTATDLAPALKGGMVDAVFVTANYPARSVAAAAAAGAHLLPIDDAVAERLRRKYPFVHRVSIPAHTYEGQARSVRTIGVDRLLVCRSDLDEALVHELTRHFIEALPEIFRPLRASARLMDLDSASATPIPLHPGAAQYYRERELAP